MLLKLFAVTFLLLSQISHGMEQAVSSRRILTSDLDEDFMSNLPVQGAKPSLPEIKPTAINKEKLPKAKPLQPQKYEDLFPSQEPTVVSTSMQTLQQREVVVASTTNLSEVIVHKALPTAANDSVGNDDRRKAHELVPNDSASSTQLPVIIVDGPQVPSKRSKSHAQNSATTEKRKQTKEKSYRDNLPADYKRSCGFNQFFMYIYYSFNDGATANAIHYDLFQKPEHTHEWSDSSSNDE